jgi:hypothetical protein
LGATNGKQSKISYLLACVLLGAVSIKPFFNICPLPVYNLFASKAGKKDFRLSSAALGLFVFQFGEAEKFLKSSNRDK